jgi:chromosome segregation ATPase
MGQCPDCGERIGKSLQHDCPHPGEKRHMVELLRAKIAELADERTAITQMLDRIEPKLDKAGGQSKELTERLAFWIDRAEKAEKERDALIPIAEAAKSCPKACCECLIVCDALKAADIESNSAEGKIVERLGE